MRMKQHIFLLALTFFPAAAQAISSAPQERLECAAGERSIDFSTTEGTLQNLDVSPDGKWIAFDLLGDIYIIPFSGGMSRLVVGGGSIDTRPVWSPDGSSIAFISDRRGHDHVFMVNVDDGAVREAPGSPSVVGREGIIRVVEWSPDGRGLFVDGWRIGLHEGNQASWTDDGQARAYYGNGESLYKLVTSEPGSASSGGFDLWRFREESSGWELSEQDFVGRPYGIESPLISRDGRWVVYRQQHKVLRDSASKETESGSDADIVVRAHDRNTHSARTILGPGVSAWWPKRSAERSLTGGGRMAISPDSRHLIVPYQGRINRVNLITGAESVVPMEVQVHKCLEPVVMNSVVIGGATMLVRNMRDITLSPDTKRLSFVALRRIYTARTSDMKPRPLAPQNVGQFQPSYSPNGKWVAFVTWTEDGGGHVWRVRATGGAPVRLTKDAGYYQHPTWSSDGKMIAFVASENVEQERPGFANRVFGGDIRVLMLSDRSTSSLNVLARFGHPLAFSADNKMITYARYSDEYALKVDLRSVSIKGGKHSSYGLDRILPEGAVDVALTSPDRTKIAIIDQGNLFLTRCAHSFDGGWAPESDCKVMRITTDGAQDPRWRNQSEVLEWTLGGAHYEVSTSDLGEDDLGDPRSLGVVRRTDIVLSVPRKRGIGSMLLTRARIVTMRGDEVIENGAVLVTDGRIVAMGDAGEVVAPKGASVVNLDGKTVVPGFIDAHAHMLNLPRDLLNTSDPEPLLNLAFGVTTTKDPSNGGDHALAYAEEIEAGESIGPRMIGAEGLLYGEKPIATLQDAIGIAKRTKSLGGTFMKYHTGYDRQQRRWLISAARQVGLNVAAHYPVSNLFGRMDLSVIDDGATTVEHAFDGSSRKYEDVVKLSAQSGAVMNFASIALAGGYASKFWSSIKDDVRIQSMYTGNGPKNVIFDKAVQREELPDLEGMAATNAKLIASIAHSGGNVAIGSHGNYDGIGFHWEMWAHVWAGMSPHETLRAATMVGAKSVGAERDLGSVEVGKVADLLILGKNPLDDIRNTISVEQVMKDGILRDAMTLEEIWPERQASPRR